MTAAIKDKKTKEMKTVVDIDTSTRIGKLVFFCTIVGAITITKKVASIFTKKPQKQEECNQ